MQPTPDFSQLIKLAQSPAAKQLISMLQSSGGSTLQDAIQKASAGDYEQAKAMLAPLLSNPQAQSLLKQLEDQK